ncbi:MAG TPA: hypothetical protein VF152_11845, partial [Acidimicrobiia bacterium]
MEREATSGETGRFWPWFKAVAPWVAAFLVPVAAVVVLALTVTRFEVTGSFEGRQLGAACPPSRTQIDDPSLLELANSGDVCTARAIVRAWESEGRIPDARQAIEWDLVLVVVYVGLLVWACLIARRWNRYRLAAALMAGVAVVAGLLDVVEDLRLLGMLDGDIDSVDASLAAGLFWTKWVLIGAAGLFGLGATIGWLRHPRPVGERMRPMPTMASEEVSDAGRMATTRPVRIAPWSWRRWLAGEPQELVVPPPVFATGVDGRRGVCCSGGGIRSAAFNLGALQALQEQQDGYGKADFLSAVSGGSYIASAVAIVASTSPPETLEAPEPPPFGHGSPEEQHLRNHSSYLAPGLLGILALVWRALRGLAINLSLVVLALVVVGLPVGWALAATDRDAGVPPDSEVFLTAPARLRVKADSKVRLNAERLPALAPNSTVVLASESRLVVRTGQRVTLFRAEGEEQEGLVELPADTSMTLAEGNRVKVEVGVADLVPGSPVQLASGSTKAATENARVTFSDASVLLVDAGRLELAEPALLDSANGRVSERCGDEPCVDRDTSEALLIVLAGLAGVALFVGLVNLVLRPSRERSSVLLETWSDRVLLAAVAVLVLGIGLPELVTFLQNRAGAARDLGGFSGAGVLAIVAALIADLSAARAVAPAVAGGKVVEKARELVSKAGPKVRAAFVSIVGALVGPLAILAVFLVLIVWAAQQRATVGQVTLATGCAVALLLLWSCGDLTRWSVHPFYKRRLSSAFALQRYTRDGFETPLVREVDYDHAIKLSDQSGKTELVVCAAANVSDLGVTPPGRPVSTFTVSRTNIGGGLLGVIKT